MGAPSSRICCFWGSTRTPSWRTGRPSMCTRPATISSSQWRREPTPAAASTFCRRIDPGASSRDSAGAAERALTGRASDGRRPRGLLGLLGLAVPFGERFIVAANHLLVFGQEFLARHVQQLLPERRRQMPPHVAIELLAALFLGSLRLLIAELFARILRLLLFRLLGLG